MSLALPVSGRERGMELVDGLPQCRRCHLCWLGAGEAPERTFLDSKIRRLLPRFLVVAGRRNLLVEVVELVVLPWMLL